MESSTIEATVVECRISSLVLGASISHVWWLVAGASKLLQSGLHARHADETRLGLQLQRWSAREHVKPLVSSSMRGFMPWATHLPKTLAIAEVETLFK
jgi:hypothetical protein